MPIERLTRTLVLASTLAGMAAGIWPLLAQPGTAVAVVLIVAASAALGRWRFDIATAAVLLFAFVAYGVVRLAAPEVSSVPFWLAAFLGLVAGSASWTAWSAPAPWRLPLAWWATSVALSWPAVALSELRLTPAATPGTAAIVGAALIQLACALWLDRMLAPASEGAAGSRARRGWLASWSMRALAASAVITAAAAIYQRTVDLSWLSGEPWTRLGRATGMMGDANPMGVATALFAPLLIASLFASPSRLRSVTTVAAALVVWAAGWASGARSTLILMAFGCAGIGLAWMAARGVRAGRAALVSLALVLAGTVVLGAILPRLSTETPVGRLIASLPHASPGAALGELFWRRDGYGLAAVEAIKARPLNGVGIGRFPPLAPSLFARVEARAIPPDNAQSLWRHTLAERGLLGTLPVLWLTILTIRRFVAPTRDAPLIVLRTMLAGFGVVLLFGYPVQDAAIAVTLATIVGWAVRDGGPRHARDAGGVDDHDRTPASAAGSLAWGVVLALSVVGAVLDLTS